MKKMKKKRRKQSDFQSLNLGSRVDVYTLLINVSVRIFSEVLEILSEDAPEHETDEALEELLSTFTSLLGDVLVAREHEDLQQDSILSADALGRKLRSIFAMELFSIYGDSEELANDDLLAVYAVAGLFVQNALNMTMQCLPSEECSDKDVLMDKAKLEISKLCVKWSEFFSNDSAELPVEVVNSFLLGAAPEIEGA